ncbi:hypothetical protein FPV67DRAFT_1564120 [Lyophyllum atratum]|nr:hypothetical protein FPV67DRAFT_1564120 [Lyophyllum atratum]
MLGKVGTDSELVYQITSWRRFERRVAPLYEGKNGSDRLSQNDTLGVASRIYVLSLPSRADRRQDMEHLRKTLGLRWTYMEAIDAENAMVQIIMGAVRLVRDTHATSTQFTWPDNAIPLNERMEPWSPGFLPAPRTFHDQLLSYPPMPCATQNYSLPPYTANKTDLPEYNILTAARIACWYSHVSIILTIANDNTLRANDAVIVLEDDVNMERDIDQRLQHVWPFLPEDWDVVYLGHCWSDESINPALNAHDSSVAINGTFLVTQIHPSSNPLCTHAYALSRSGARRLLLHLRYPLFAYSRSIDKAISWLIQSGRLRSYSIVPSVVVQRKTGRSDIMAGKGSTWRASLLNGVFEN